jgi:dTDP-4-amino-4,6-dideoxygalactose transaminase
MKHCIGVGNGTDALEIAIASLNLPPNSEIIVQGNTYVATCMAVINNNHKLVLADIENNKIILNITPNTKVIIVVHMYGIPLNNLDSVIEICNKNNIILIEDCAQAHGAIYCNKKVGSFGDISCFSFYPTKNLGACGDGGCIMTNSDDINKWIRMYKNFGSVSKNNHIMIGRNSRLDTIQASILNIKLKYLDNDNNMRKQNAKYYYDLLKNINIPHTYSDNNVYHLFTILADDRDKLMLYLKDHNIETAIHYPNAICDMYIFNTNNTPNCSELSKHILSLPMYPELTYEEIKYVCDHINDY